MKKPERLESADDLRGWFDQSRGSLELINGSDVRIGIDGAATPGADIVVRGFGRVDGEFPMMLLGRVNGSDAKPVGYRLLEGTDRLSGDQLLAFQKLPPTFQFKEAVQIYGKTDNPTKKYLEKLIGFGLLERDPDARGRYRKLSPTGSPGAPVIPMPSPLTFKAA